MPTTVLALSTTAPAQPRRVHRRVAVVVACTFGVTCLVGVGSLLRPAAQPAAESATGVGSGVGRTTLGGLTAYVESVPDDWGAWSTLGLLQLERGRSTGSPEWYGRAEQSFGRSLQLHGEGNPPALAGLAAVAAVRHDFSQAEAEARKALSINPLDANAQAILVDALSELGRYDEALAAAQRLDETHPGLSAFARLAYQEELRGHVPQALSLLSLAADDASSPSQVAFARYHEGVLALQSGDVARAQQSLRQGLGVAPEDLTLLHLSARIAVSLGDDAAAADDYRRLVQRRPIASYAVEAADVLARMGDSPAAADLVSLAQAQLAVNRANGVNPEPSDVVLEATYGNPADALALAESLWARQKGVYAADAYAVALHAVGRDREALVFSDRALALGTSTPSLREHRAAIVASLRGGQR